MILVNDILMISWFEQEIAEEHDALIQEKTQSEEDLVKLENKVQEMVLKFETDSQRQHNNFQTHYGDIPPEFRKVSDTCRSTVTSVKK